MIASDPARSDEGPLAGEICGIPVVRRYTSVAREIAAIRASVALSELPHIAVVRLSGEAAFDVMDRVCPAALYARDGQLLHTLLFDKDGALVADAYVGNDDGAYLVVADGIAAGDLERHLAVSVAPGEDAHTENLSTTHTMLGLNGPFAWELLAAVEGPEVIGFPYLSFYRPDADRLYFRAGKTGEFGYDLLVPRASVQQVAQQIAERGAAFDLAFAGTDALAHCAFENWFFDIHSRARAGLTPVELHLQWRIAPGKDFVGAAALRERSASRAPARITAFESERLLREGDAVTFNGATIGRVVEAIESITLGRPIGLALLDRRYAHSGIDRYRARRDRDEVQLRTVSPPFVQNLSLAINPQRHAYVDRAEIRAPSPRRRAP